MRRFFSVFHLAGYWLSVDCCVEYFSFLHVDTSISVFLKSLFLSMSFVILLYVLLFAFMCAHKCKLSGG